MKIINMQKTKVSGKLKAFFAVEWPDKMVIRDCKLIEGDQGELFAAMPSRQYEHNGQKKWTNIVQILDQGLLEKITKAARAVYDGGGQEREDLPF